MLYLEEVGGIKGKTPKTRASRIEQGVRQDAEKACGK